MKHWKLTNTCPNNVRLVVTLGPAHSKGVILKSGDSIMCNPQRTPAMDAQIRRKVVELDMDFNNDLYELVLGEIYSREQMEQKKMDKSIKDATQYIEKK